MFVVSVSCGFQSSVLFLDAPGNKTWKKKQFFYYCTFEKRETDWDSCKWLLTYSIRIVVCVLNSVEHRCLSSLTFISRLYPLVNCIGATSLPANQSIIDCFADAFLSAMRRRRKMKEKEKGETKKRCTLGQLSIVWFFFLCKTIVWSQQRYEYVFSTRSYVLCDARIVGNVIFIRCKHDRMTTALFDALFCLVRVTHQKPEEMTGHLLMVAYVIFETVIAIYWRANFLNLFTWQGIAE